MRFALSNIENCILDICLGNFRMSVCERADSTFYAGIPSLCAMSRPAGVMRQRISQLLGRRWQVVLQPVPITTKLTGTVGHPTGMLQGRSRRSRVRRA